jgi:hypothetical protein
MGQAKGGWSHPCTISKAAPTMSCSFGHGGPIPKTTPDTARERRRRPPRAVNPVTLVRSRRFGAATGYATEAQCACKDERLGQPVVPNGIPLSKIHYAAFDAHLIGIDADYRLHVSERLLGKNDGPVLESLKRLDGETIHLPGRTKDRPDRDRLALRFERFKAVA